MDSSNLGIGNPQARRLAQCLEPYLFLRLTAFHEPQSLAQRLAGILISAGGHQPLDELGLFVRPALCVPLPPDPRSLRAPLRFS